MDLARFEKSTDYSWHSQFAPSKYDVIWMSVDIMRVKGNEVRLVEE